jgi:hypothetical protein
MTPRATVVHVLPARTSSETVRPASAAGSRPLATASWPAVSDAGVTVSVPALGSGPVGPVAPVEPVAPLTPVGPLGLGAVAPPVTAFGGTLVAAALALAAAASASAPAQMPEMANGTPERSRTTR